MAKETEGQRRQEVQDRQLVKGRGGRIWNDKKEMHDFLSMYSTHRNLCKGNEERGKRRGGAGVRVEKSQHKVTDPEPEGRRGRWVGWQGQPVTAQVR